MQLIEEYGDDKFTAGMGGEADPRDAQAGRHPHARARRSAARCATATSEAKRKKIAKRLKVVEAFRESGNKPEWMMLDGHPGASAGPAPARSARRRPLRDVRSRTTSIAASSTATTA